MYKKSLKIPKGVIRFCKSKDRQYNGQKKKDKKKTNGLQNTTYKTIEQHEHHEIAEVKSGSPEG
jgi:hypothetical protein